MSSSEARVGAIVVAAGAGTRFSSDGPAKQFRPLLGHPLVAWSVSAFRRHPRIEQIVVVLPPPVAEDPPAWVRALGADLVPGGAERIDSVAAGLRALSAGVDRVLVHDAARPLVPEELVDRVLAPSGASVVIPGLPVVDTLKEVGADGIVRSTHDRARYRTIQTPQSFPRALLHEVHERARREGWSATDDAALAERCGYAVAVVAGDHRALKVTTEIDLLTLEALARTLPAPHASSPAGPDERPHRTHRP